MAIDSTLALQYITSLFGGSLYRSDFDQEAYIATSKALCIIFILLILFSNALLIYKNARKLDFYTRPKNQIIISLAIGDIFLALFPLVVLAKTLFGDYRANLELCRLLMTSDTYLRYLIHFVYGLGICVLGLELIFRNKIHNMTDSKTKKIVVSLALSSFPWLLGLIVVLPLSLANWDQTTCEIAQTLDQRKAAFVISVILPACAAVIMCIVINCCVFTSTRYQQQTVASQPMVIVSTNTSSSQMQSGNGYTAPPPYGYYPDQQYPQQPIHGQYPLQQYPQQMNNPKANQPYVVQQPNTPPQPFTVPQPLTTPQPHTTAQPHTAAQPYPTAQPYTTTEQNQGVHLQNSTGNTLANVHREKSRLLAIAVLFFLLVVPQAIFYLSYNLNENITIILNRVAFVAISNFVFWIMVIRSILTPLIMYCYSDDL